jgi:hypothetical protein
MTLHHEDRVPSEISAKEQALGWHRLFVGSCGYVPFRVRVADRARGPRDGFALMLYWDKKSPREAWGDANSLQIPDALKGTRNEKSTL